MKAFYKVSIVVVLSCLSVFAYGQRFNESDFGKFYIRLGVSLPQGHFKNAFDPAIPLYQNIDQEGGMSAETGINIEFGKYYFLHEDPIQEMFKVGLDATFFSANYLPIAWPVETEDSNYNLFTFSVKLGPVVSFNVAEDMYADLFIKAVPTFITSSSDIFYTKGEEDGYESLSLFNESSSAFALRSDIGINLRYRKGSLTLSYESGKVKTDSWYYNGEDIDYQGKMPMGIFQAKLGFQIF